MNKTNHIIFIICTFLVFNACGVANTVSISSSISGYNKAKNQVRLGDPKNKVLSILEPTQRSLFKGARKPPESFLDQSGKLTEIYYFRSSRQADGLTTDDEFTPYVFYDDRLVAIGWASMGGPHTQGQTRPQINIRTTNTIYR
ncbi:DUF3192 domain-containing protein [bacterium]|nr:DUF3192 domain-containing protein [bacterium]